MPSSNLYNRRQDRAARADFAAGIALAMTRRQEAMTMRDSMSLGCVLVLIMLFAMAKLGISAARAVDQAMAPSLAQAQAQK